MIYYVFYIILYALELCVESWTVFNKRCVVQCGAVQCSYCRTVRKLYSTVISTVYRPVYSTAY